MNGIGEQIGDDYAHDLIEIHQLALGPRAADAGEIQQIFHERPHLRGALHDLLNVAVGLGFEMSAVVFEEQVGEAVNMA